MHSSTLLAAGESRICSLTKKRQNAKKLSPHMEADRLSLDSIGCVRRNEEFWPRYLQSAEKTPRLRSRIHIRSVRPRPVIVDSLLTSPLPTLYYWERKLPRQYLPWCPAKQYGLQSARSESVIIIFLS